MPIFTKAAHILLASGSTRIVHGGRGDYMEFSPEQMNLAALHVPQEQEYRLSDRWKNIVYYIWYETKDGVKVYFQKKTVAYADYLLGYYYVDPRLVVEE